MSLQGKRIFVNGWECVVMLEGVGYRTDEIGHKVIVPVITVSRCEGAHLKGNISIGNVSAIDHNIFLPPSSYDCRDSEFYSAITGDYS